MSRRRKCGDKAQEDTPSALQLWAAWTSSIRYHYSHAIRLSVRSTVLFLWFYFLSLWSQKKTKRRKKKSCEQINKLPVKKKKKILCGNKSWLFDQVTLSSFFPRCELGLKNLINSQLSLIRWLLQAWGWGDGDPLVWTWQLLQQKGALPYSSQPWQTSGHRKLKQTSMENKKKKKRNLLIQPILYFTFSLKCFTLSQDSWSVIRHALVFSLNNAVLDSALNMPHLSVDRWDAPLPRPIAVTPRGLTWTTLIGLNQHRADCWAQKQVVRGIFTLKWDSWDRRGGF